jgi:serpin B
MKKALFSIFAIILTLSLVSCGPAGTVTVTQTETQTVTDTITEEVTQTQTEIILEKYGQLLKSKKAYNSTPNVKDTALETLVNGNNEFAFDLYKQIIATQDGNLFYSPYSLSLASAMTYAGVKGQTKEQIADVFNFLLQDEELHAAFNRLAIELNSRDDLPDSSMWQGYTLNTINAIWGQKDYGFKSEYLDVMSENYDAGIRLLDFMLNNKEAIDIINNWIEEQTNGKIEEILTEDNISPLTRIVLTNVIYFRANWRCQFETGDTYNDTFYPLDGSEIAVPMMHQTDHFNYTGGDGYQAIELMYDKGDLSMLIFLPNADNFDDFESSVTADLLDGISADMEFQQVVLTMPKFDYSSYFTMKEILQIMGMTDAFDPETADFTGMTDYALWLDDAIHQACISVNEKGTEAVAASITVGVAGSSPEPPQMNINRPFIYLIRDNVTNTILFVGRVMNPAE